MQTIPAGASSLSFGQMLIEIEIFLSHSSLSRNYEMSHERKLSVNRRSILIPEAEQKSITNEESAAIDNTLDAELGEVSLKVKTYIRQKLLEKDVEIQQLQAENQQLQTNIKSLSEENHVYRERLHVLDKVRQQFVLFKHDLLHKNFASPHNNCP